MSSRIWVFLAVQAATTALTVPIPAPAPAAAEEGCRPYGTSFRSLGTLDQIFSMSRVDRVGDIACIVKRSGGCCDFQTYDMSVPTAPVHLGTANITAGGYDVSADAEYAVVAARTNGIDVVSISDPANPVVIANLPMPGSPTRLVTGIAIARPYAFATSEGSSRFHVIDLSIPEAPFEVTSIPLAAQPRGVALSGSYAFVAGGVSSGNPALTVVDVSNPLAPVIVGSVARTPLGFDLEIHGGILYLLERTATSTTLEIFDISAPATPVSIGSVLVTDADVAEALTYSDGRVFLACDASGLWVVDVANPAAPVVIGTLAAIGTVSDLTVAGGAALLIGSKLEVIDVSNPYSPPVIGRVDTPGNAFDVRASWPYAYVADGAFGIQVVDLSAPASPVIIGGYDTPGSAGNIMLSGSLAYVADGGSLQILDITNPASPAFVGSCAIPNNGQDVVVQGTLAYLATNEGLRIVDVSNPAAPALMGSAALTEGDLNGRGVAVSGKYAFVLTDLVPSWYGPDLEVFDVTNPMAPFRVARLGGSVPGSLTIANGRLYVAGATSSPGHGTFRIRDLDAPTALPYIATALTQNSAAAIVIEDDIAYVATSLAGLEAFDISDETAPKMLACVPTDGLVGGIAIAGQYVVLACGGAGGLQVVPKDCVMATGLPTPTALEGSRPALTAWPTPSRADVSFSIRVPWETPVALGIFDVTGRTVRRLVGSTVPAGESVVTWDGRDDDRHDLPSGHYLARLEWQDGSTTQKVVLVR